MLEIEVGLRAGGRKLSLEGLVQHFASELGQAIERQFEEALMQSHRPAATETRDRSVASRVLNDPESQVRKILEGA